MGLAIAPGIGVLVAARSPHVTLLLSSINAFATIRGRGAQEEHPAFPVGSTVWVDVSVTGASNGLTYTWSKDGAVLGESGPSLVVLIHSGLSWCLAK